MRVTAERLLFLHAVDLVSSSVVDIHTFQFNLSFCPLSSQSKVALLGEASQKTEVVFLVLGYQSFVPHMYANEYKIDILCF